jgi:uncharacterized protein (TIGR03437 family)
VTAVGIPLPYILAGITVTVGGAPAPLFAVAALPGYQQVNFQVPFVTSENFEVVIQQNGMQGMAPATQATRVTHGDFFRLPGRQYGIFQHSADYSLVTESNPARQGEILVTYVTGVRSPLAFEVPVGQPAPLNQVDPVGQYNAGAASDTYNIVANGEPIGAIGDPNALAFLGLAPGLVGVFQINFVLSPSVAPGDVQITLRETTYNAMFDITNTNNSSVVLLPVQ